MDEIKVSVVQFGKESGKKKFMLRYVDPTTGKQKHKSAKTAKNKSEATKLAGKWEEELRSGVAQPSKVTWEHFRERYESEVLTTLATATNQKVQCIFDSVEKHIDPLLLRSLDADRISILQTKLKGDGLAASTIKTHLAHLLAALRWAESVNLLVKVPKVKMPQRAKGSAMKGRPITGEEFDRLLAAVPKVFEDGKETGDATKLAYQSKRDESWRYYLRGLWLSGLRLAESLELGWDKSHGLSADMQPGEHPMLVIRAEHEKGNQDRLLPMAPEFAEFLQQTPESERTGYVFNPLPKRPKSKRLSVYRVCDIAGEIGEKAGIKVKTEKRGDKEIVKFASAHDLRRSFGLRWAHRVMPQVLMELMRHASISTTMEYYVGRNAQTTAAVLWAAHDKAQASETLQSKNSRDISHSS